MYNNPNLCIKQMQYQPLYKYMCLHISMSVLTCENYGIGTGEIPSIPYEHFNPIKNDPLDESQE